MKPRHSWLWYILRTQVASWGAYLLSRNILTVSFAPRDTHEAQVQFALERGVPALIGVLASIQLPYPSRAFDMAHCSRCLIPWGKNDGLYLIEVDRILRPGGYWIFSGPPINWESRWKGSVPDRDNPFACLAACGYSCIKFWFPLEDAIGLYKILVHFVVDDEHESNVLHEELCCGAFGDSRVY
ncbi:hypothetical protein POM88_050103 [Heracleum sosnowskyi]|uniref:Methyltransferase n=1 Tax=Heracleum sosnowskyi TaxID=360622 RepID=A0AAD8GZE2_9APIA|nr:hypothetical protein POM88_050103 [Heracleum sosnowskyi]